MINHDLKTIDCWWPISPKPGNFGDILTPYIIKHLSGYTPIYKLSPFKTPTFLGVGSIMNCTTNLTTVWGSGIISKLAKPDPHANYLAVRGPITRQYMLDKGIYVPEIYGDPALLMPKLYNPPIQKTCEIGLFGHYVDTEQLSRWYPINTQDTRIINPINANVTKVIDQVLSCNRIVSSSLHGLIIAHAYGIPASWVKISDKLHGDDSKFFDYFESVGIYHSHSEFREKKTMDELINLPYNKFNEFDSTPLLGAFPLPI